MPTPLFCLRVPQHVQDDLLKVSKVYGAPNVRAFVREALEIISAPDVAGLGRFGDRIARATGEQLAFNLTTPPQAVKKPRLKAKRKGGRYASTTR